MGANGTACGGGSRIGWIAERGKIYAARGDDRRASEDRTLPFHHFDSEPWPRVHLGRGELFRGRYSGVDRRSKSGTWIGNSISAPSFARSAAAVRARRERRC